MRQHSAYPYETKQNNEEPDREKSESGNLSFNKADVGLMN